MNAGVIFKIGGRKQNGSEILTAFVAGKLNLSARYLPAFNIYRRATVAVCRYRFDSHLREAIQKICKRPLSHPFITVQPGFARCQR